VTETLLFRVLHSQHRQEVVRSGRCVAVIVVVVVGADRITHLISHSGGVRAARVLLELLRLLHAGHSVLALHVAVERLPVPDEHQTKLAPKDPGEVNVLDVPLHVVAPVTRPTASPANPLAPLLDQQLEQLLFRIVFVEIARADQADPGGQGLVGWSAALVVVRVGVVGLLLSWRPLAGISPWI